MNIPQALITMMARQVIRDFTNKNPDRSSITMMSSSLSSLRRDESTVLLHRHAHVLHTISESSLPNSFFNDPPSEETSDGACRDPLKSSSPTVHCDRPGGRHLHTLRRYLPFFHHHLIAESLISCELPLIVS
jgi:hypothetical protein